MRRALRFQRKQVVIMFESDQEAVQHLLHANSDFKSLYDRHDELKTQVRDAEQGVNPVDDLALGTLKKEKLLTKDRMAAIIEQHRVAQAAQQ